MNQFVGAYNNNAFGAEDLHVVRVSGLEFGESLEERTYAAIDAGEMEEYHRLLGWKNRDAQRELSEGQNAFSQVHNELYFSDNGDSGSPPRIYGTYDVEVGENRMMINFDAHENVVLYDITKGDVYLVSREKQNDDFLARLEGELTQRGIAEAQVGVIKSEEYDTLPSSVSSVLDVIMYVLNKNRKKESVDVAAY